MQRVLFFLAISSVFAIADTELDAAIDKKLDKVEEVVLGAKQKYDNNKDTIEKLEKANEVRKELKEIPLTKKGLAWYGIKKGAKYGAKKYIEHVEKKAIAKATGKIDEAVEQK